MAENELPSVSSPPEEPTSQVPGKFSGGLPFSGREGQWRERLRRARAASAQGAISLRFSSAAISHAYGPYARTRHCEKDQQEQITYETHDDISDPLERLGLLAQPTTEETAVITASLQEIGDRLDTLYEGDSAQQAAQRQLIEMVHWRLFGGADNLPTHAARHFSKYIGSEEQDKVLALLKPATTPYNKRLRAQEALRTEVVTDYIKQSPAGVFFDSLAKPPIDYVGERPHTSAEIAGYAARLAADAATEVVHPDEIVLRPDLRRPISLNVSRYEEERVPDPNRVADPHFDPYIRTRDYFAQLIHDTEVRLFPGQEATLTPQTMFESNANSMRCNDIMQSICAEISQASSNDPTHDYVYERVKEAFLGRDKWAKNGCLSRVAKDMAGRLGDWQRSDEAETLEWLRGVEIPEAAVAQESKDMLEDEADIRQRQQSTPIAVVIRDTSNGAIETEGRMIVPTDRNSALPTRIDPSSVDLTIGFLTAFCAVYYGDTQMPHIPGYQTVAQRKSNDGRLSIFDFIKSDDADPYRSCDIAIDQQNAQKLAVRYRTAGYTALSESLIATMPATIDDFAGQLRDNSIYHLRRAAEQMEEKRRGRLTARNGQLLLQCDTAHSNALTSLKKLDPELLVRAVSGVRLNTIDGSVITLQAHKQTGILSTERNYYILDTTPTQVDNSVPTHQETSTIPMELPDMSHETTATEPKTEEKQLDPRGGLAEQRLQAALAGLTATRMRFIRDTRIQLGIEKDPVRSHETNLWRTINKLPEGDPLHTVTRHIHQATPVFTPPLTEVSLDELQTRINEVKNSLHTLRLVSDASPTDRSRVGQGIYRPYTNAHILPLINTLEGLTTHYNSLYKARGALDKLDQQ